MTQYRITVRGISFFTDAGDPDLAAKALRANVPDVSDDDMTTLSRVGTLPPLRRDHSGRPLTVVPAKAKRRR